MFHTVLRDSLYLPVQSLPGHGVVDADVQNGHFGRDMHHRNGQCLYSVGGGYQGTVAVCLFDIMLANLQCHWTLHTFQNVFDRGEVGGGKESGFHCVVLKRQR